MGNVVKQTSKQADTHWQEVYNSISGRGKRSERDYKVDATKTREEVLAEISERRKPVSDICYEIAHWNNNQKIQRRIVSAANRYQLKSGETLVIPCVRHYSREHHLILDNLDLISRHVVDDDQGFIDQFSNYWTRKEALIIATNAGQINTVREKSFPEDRLFSEDLY